MMACRPTNSEVQSTAPLSEVSLPYQNAEPRDIQWRDAGRQAVLLDDGSIVMLNLREVEVTIPPKGENEVADRFKVDHKHRIALVASTDTLDADYSGKQPRWHSIPKRALAFGFFRSSVVLIAKNHVYVYDLRGGENFPLKAYATANIYSAAVGIEGNRVAELTEDGSRQILDISSNMKIEQRCYVEGVPFTYHIAVSGGSVFMGVDEINEVRVLQISDKCHLSQILKLPGKGTLEEMSVAGGKIALSIRNVAMAEREERIEIWNASSRQVISVKNMCNDCGPMALSPTGQWLAVIRGPSRVENLLVEER
jgi:hypothetical protein